MKYYVQFTHANDARTRMRDAVGSDGVFILDGRNNLETFKVDAQQQMHRLRKVASFDGYKIIKAESFLDKENLIYAWIRAGALGSEAAGKTNMELSAGNGY